MSTSLPIPRNADGSYSIIPIFREGTASGMATVVPRLAEVQYATDTGALTIGDGVNTNALLPPFAWAGQRTSVALENWTGHALASISASGNCVIVAHVVVVDTANANVANVVYTAAIYGGAIVNTPTNVTTGLLDSGTLSLAFAISGSNLVVSISNDGNAGTVSVDLSKRPV